MTKKDFELIAAAIRSLNPTHPMDKGYIAAHFARALGATNPRFDSGRFVDACMQGGK